MTSQDRPNILLIVVHDLGTHLGCYGHDSVPSPALDQLASEGILFERHFGTAAYCSPSRGALLTGLHPHSNGLMGLVNLGWDMPQSTVMLSQRLQKAGYETLLLGFQHEVKDVDRLNELFDYVGPRSYYCEEVAAEVAEFLDGRGGQAAKPFYARVGFFEVHRYYDRYVPAPIEDAVVPPFLDDTPGAREDFAQFYGSIRAMDAAVGRILDALDRSGMAEDTIIVFTTDHGIDFPRAKGTLYDPGIHTALLMRWPRRLKAGLRIGEMVSSVDLLPTVLEATGVPVPEDTEGRSYWGLLNGLAYEPNPQVYAEMNTVVGDSKRCIRTDRHKYIRNYDEGPALCMGTCTEISLTRRDMGDDHLDPRPPVELYDLGADPLETVNLAGRHEYQAVERDLRDRLDAFLVDTGDPIVHGPIRRPAEEADIARRIWRELPGDSHHPMRDIDAYLDRYR